MKTTILALSMLSIVTMAGAQNMHKMDMARYGGPTYLGKPALGVTASLLNAGGGATSFSIAKALTEMVGEKTVGAELGKLTKQYGKARVGRWVTVFDYAVADAVKYVTEAKVELPEPSLKGATLAETLVKASMDRHNVIYTELLLDKAITHGIHDKVMEDIDAKYSPAIDVDYHRITNQALYDLGRALKVKHVRLAHLH